MKPEQAGAPDFYRQAYAALAQELALLQASAGVSDIALQSLIEHIDLCLEAAYTYGAIRALNG